jgi:hypothetical protein
VDGFPLNVGQLVRCVHRRQITAHRVQS